jgi:hypothetical protein
MGGCGCLGSLALPLALLNSGLASVRLLMAGLASVRL